MLFLASPLLTTLGAFEREVFRLLEHDKFLLTPDSLPSSSWEWDDDTEEFLARYVEYLPHHPDTPFYKHFPSMINHVLDKIIDLDGDADPVLHSRPKYLRTLCRWASKDFAQYSKPKGLLLEHIFVAAVYLHKNTICMNHISFRFCVSDVWGRPMIAAIRTENVTLIHLLLQWGVRPDAVSGWWPSWDITAAVRAERAEEIFTIFALPQWNIQWYHSAIVDALDVAIVLEKNEVAHILLDIDRRRQVNGWTTPILKNMFAESCKRGMNELSARFLELLDNMSQVWPWDTADSLVPVLNACAQGDEEALKKLMKNGAEIHGEIYDHPLMMAAAQKGHVGILRLLLDAGEILNTVQAVKILRNTAHRAQAAGAIRFLLEQKSIVLDTLSRAYPVADTHPAHLVTAAIQSGNIEYVEALAEFGILLNDEKLFRDGDCPLPIVTAVVFRQSRMINRLKELGAEEVRDKLPVIQHCGCHVYLDSLPT